MRQVRSDEHQVAGGEFLKAVADKPPATALENECQLAFRMEMPRNFETGQSEFPYGKGMQLAFGDQFKLSFGRKLHSPQTLMMSAHSSKAVRVNTLAVFSRAGGDRKNPLC